jgi:hypothetical protein
MLASEDAVLTLAHDDGLVLFDLLQRRIVDEGGENLRAHVRHDAQNGERISICLHPRDGAVAAPRSYLDSDARRRSCRAFRLAPNHRGPVAECPLFGGYDTDAQFARSSLLRKRSTVASATSLAMKLWPMPRVRMKVSLPRSTFLS